MARQITAQDISWFLDLHRKQQLNFNPPYQRRSVWPPRDRRFFIDTILNDYPAPPVFLHKTIDQQGSPTYHVVDGKQRLQTIVDFTENKVRVPDDFADVTLQGKRWVDLPQETKLAFWNYSIIVEMLPDVGEATIRSIFDRINRNARQLTRQELRHAKYDGWFIHFVETEADRPEWADFGVVTTGRAKRMADVQFISELCAVVLNNRVIGFNQNFLDDLYAEFEDISELDDFHEDDFRSTIESHKAAITVLLNCQPDAIDYLKTQSHFYSLWAYLHLTDTEWDTDRSAEYSAFLEAVQSLLKTASSAAELRTLQLDDVPHHVFDYALNTRGANTDEGPRTARHESLLSAIVSQ